ncbi:MAG: hypothetical protein ACI8U4_001925 [Natronomonas sp.]|jgi:hypothetical protein
MAPSLPEAAESELVSAARTAVGDEIRSITHFTEESVNQLYLREDLEPDADLVGFADIERLGFHSQQGYRTSELGEYQFTIRAFERGYLTRVIEGDHGVFVTTDPMARNRFEELASAIREVLASTDD